MSIDLPARNAESGFLVLDLTWCPVQSSPKVAEWVGSLPQSQPVWDSWRGLAELPLGEQLLRAMADRQPGHGTAASLDGSGLKVQIEPITDGGLLLLIHPAEGDSSAELGERFRQAYEQSPEGFILFEPVRDETGELIDFYWLYQNPAAYALIGRSAAEVVGCRLLDLFPENRSAGSFDRYRHVAETGEPDRYEFKFVGSGLDTYFRTTTTRVGGSIAIVFSDIKDEITAAEHQRTLTERYQLVVESTNDVLRDWDMVSGEVSWNESLADVFGYPVPDDGGAFWETHLHPDDRHPVVTSLHEALSSGESIWRAEYRFMRHDGSVATVLDRAVIARDEAGHARRMVGSMQDITEQRRLESERLLVAEVEAARQTAEAGEARLRAFIEHLPVTVAVLDREGHYLATSQRWLHLRGMDRDEVIGRAESDLFPETASYWQPIYRDVMASGAVRREAAVSLPDAAGTPRWWRWEVQPWQGEGDQSGGVIVHLEDITDERQLEQDRQRLALEAVAAEERTRALLRLQLVFEQVPAAVAVMRGPEHVFEMTNSTYVEMSGNRTLLGLSAQEAFPDLIGQGFFELLDQVYETGRVIELKEAEAQLVRDGQPHRVFVNLVYAPLIEGDQVYGVFVFAVDLTETVEARLKIERLERQSRSIVEAVAQIVWTNDAEGRMTGSQPLWGAFTGQSEAEYQGFGWSGAVHLDDIQPSIEAWQEAVAERKMFAFEHRVRRHDGVYRTFSIRAVPVLNDDGSVREWVGAHTDITERREQQQELERLSRSLKRQNQTLARVNEQLRQVDQMKSNFISSVSHEIRTPLTSIKSFAKILQNDVERDRLNPAKRAQFLGIINDESDRLTRLINDVLDIAKMESGKMTWNDGPTDLNEVAERSVQSVKPLIDARQITLAMGTDPQMGVAQIDPDKLQQIFTNLLSNAIKFTPEGGRIVVTGQRLEASDPAARPALAGLPRGVNTVQSWYYWSVADTGTGIPTEELGRIFEQFHQVTQNDALDKPKGTGLGLPITRHIVEHYGGRIWATSTLGNGSSFHVVLPTSLAVRGDHPLRQATPDMDEADELSVPTDTTQVPARQRTVLVVDDEPNIRTSIRYELERNGWRVIEAGNGLEAVELARQEHPSVITLDIMMPELSGFDVISVLKADESVRDIPILMVSILDDVSRGFELGAADYLAKPLNSDVLLAKVLRLTRSNSSKAAPTGAARRALCDQTMVICSDDPTFGEAMAPALEANGCCLTRTINIAAALHHLRQEPPDLLLIDSRLQEQQHLVEAVQQDPALCEVVMMVATPIGSGLAMLMVTIGCLSDPQHEPQLNAILERFRRFPIGRPLRGF